MKIAKLLKPTPWKISIAFCLLIVQTYLMPIISTAIPSTTTSELVKTYLGGPFALMVYLIDPVGSYYIDKLAFIIVIAVVWLALWYILASLIVERLGKKK